MFGLHLYRKTGRKLATDACLGRTMTEASWIVALGGNELNAGLELVARRRGARLVVVDWNDRPPFVGDLHLRLDIKDSDRVVDALRPLVDRLLFAYTSSDVATETAARIHAAHGLLRPPARALAIASHKPTMDAIWASQGLLHKRFRPCGSLGDLIEFHRSVGDDSIVKPAAAASSRGVTVVRTGDGDRALVRAWTRARDSDPNGEVIVEEYVRGTEFTAEMVGDSKGHVQVLAVSRKYHSANAGRNRVATKLHYNPLDLSRARALGIADFARRCFQALRLHTSLGHLELIERPDGQLVPLELGARSSGFVATHLVDAATRSDRTFLGIYEGVLRGEQVTDTMVPPGRSSMWFSYDFPDGIGTRSGTDLMQFTPPGIESVAYNRSKLTRGMSFREIDGDAERHGFEILIGDAGTLTIDAVTRAESAHRREFLDEREAHLGGCATSGVAGAA